SAGCARADGRHGRHPRRGVRPPLRALRRHPDRAGAVARRHRQADGHQAAIGMAWRALLCGLALGASVLLPLGVGRPAAALDEVLILARYRSSTGANMLPRGRGHPGVDFAERLGAPVLAVADGVVSYLIDSPVGCGHGVVVEHAGFARWSAYCHMQTVTVD